VYGPELIETKRHFLVLRPLYFLHKTQIEAFRYLVRLEAYWFEQLLNLTTIRENQMGRLFFDKSNWQSNHYTQARRSENSPNCGDQSSESSFPARVASFDGAHLMDC
jgi:hypothetical protein